jgi:hypothetical protein
MSSFIRKKFFIFIFIIGLIAFFEIQDSVKSSKALTFIPNAPADEWFEKQRAFPFEKSGRSTRKSY